MTMLVADIGGTRAKIGVVRDGRVLAQEHIDARSSEGLAPQLPRIAAVFESLCAELEVGYETCDALSIAFPSLVDQGPPTRILTSYGKFEDAPQLDLSRWARESFGLELLIENDARMALLGEWQEGAGRNCDSLVMLTLGTGLGTAAIIDGQLLRGRHGQAGVLGGHMTVRVGGNLCTCGNRGCGEAEASTSVLHSLAARHVDFHRSALKGIQQIDFAAILSLARKHDACALALRAQCIEVWSAVIVNLIHAYDPERVIVGGGIMAGKSDFFSELQRSVLLNAHAPWGRIDIVPSQLGDAAALIGGEALFRERQSD